MTHAPPGSGADTVASETPAPVSQVPVTQVRGAPADPGLIPALFAIGRRLRRAAGDTPVDQAGLVVLHRVSCSLEVRPSDIAADLGLDASTVSRHVRSLEQLGLVERSDDPEDRRAQLVSLSRRGREVLETALAQRRAVVAAAVAGWSEDDRLTLERLLVRLADDLDGVSAEQVGQ